MGKKVIGIDFGTLSARAIIIDTDSGNELCEAVSEYRHAVMDEVLPCGKKLEPKTALQHPADYLESLKTVISETLEKSGTNADEISAICIDFTTCTMISTDSEGIPLCFDEKHKNEPNAYAMLWKHHASQQDADRLLEVALKRNEPWLKRYGNKISSEWLFSKILQILRQTPEIYYAADRFLDAADWLTLMLTGNDVRNAAMAGFKGLWDDGYPSDEYFKEIDPRLAGIVGTKVCTNVQKPDGIAGYINKHGAELTGLCEGTPIAVPLIDAQAPMAALGITGAGEMMLVLGTSGCQEMLSENGCEVKGILGYANSSVMPGLYTYEAAQAGVGDAFDWFVKNYVPKSYQEQADEKGINLHQLLTEKAKNQKVGEHGILALDWLNGNRCVLNDSDLSGLFVGVTLATKPEDIYRAIIESTAYGTRSIIEALENSGVEVKSICATGGIALKNEMLMQIYADVTGREIRVTSSKQSAAYGCALYAAVACGEYESIFEASAKLKKPDATKYIPVAKNNRIYTELYNEYVKLHDYFGRGENNVMKKLDKLKREAYNEADRD